MALVRLRLLTKMLASIAKELSEFIELQRATATRIVVIEDTAGAHKAGKGVQDVRGRRAGS